MNRDPGASAQAEPVSNRLDTPVLMLLFNSADTTARVFSQVRAMQPRTLLVSADGPRDAAEAERCAEARAVIDGVDWDCDLRTQFSERNLGGPLACSGAIDWAFAQVERAIILEDDCLPEPDFFHFCETMLDRYADDPAVMHICGSNFIAYRPDDGEDYHFSRYASAWGWATWRRAWESFDLRMRRWPQARRDGLLEKSFPSGAERRFWRHVFQRVARGESIHWDYAWKFACLVENGLAVVPNANLISNIGFGPDATHTRNEGSFIANLPLERLDSTRLRHPSRVAVNDRADELTFECRYRRTRRTPGFKLQRLLETIARAYGPGGRARAARSGGPKLVRLAGAAAGTICTVLARLRRRASPVARPRFADGKVFVHLGCGDVDHPAFVNVDLLPFPHVHYLAPVDRLPMFGDDSVDLVYACHCLEHFSHTALPEVLGEWIRILKPGGVLRLSVPDFDKLLSIYNDSGKDSEAIVLPLMGGQDYAYNFHYNIFTERQLTRALTRAGFSSVRAWTPETDKLTHFDDWSGRDIQANGQSYPVSLNLEAEK